MWLHTKTCSAPMEDMVPWTATAPLALSGRTADVSRRCMAHHQRPVWVTCLQQPCSLTGCGNTQPPSLVVRPPALTCKDNLTARRNPPAFTTIHQQNPPVERCTVESDWPITGPGIRDCSGHSLRVRGWGFFSHAGSNLSTVL